MMSVFFILLTQEIKINFRKLSQILASFLFFVIFLSSFYLVDSDHAISDATIILFSLISCLIFSSTEFLKKDFESGASEQILLCCENFEIFIAAKILANWLVCVAPILLLVAVIKADFFTIALLVSFLVNLICCFCGSLSILGNVAPMIAALALPLIIPTLLIALAQTDSSINLLIGLCFFLAPILIFATTKIVKIAHE